MTKGTWNYGVDPLQTLQNSSSAIVQQELELIEAITGCETQNKYHVYTGDNGNFNYLFKCKEKSSCLTRYCCS